MTTKKHPLATLLESTGGVLSYGDLSVRFYGNNIVNIDTIDDSRFTNDHLDLFREDLKSAGYVEVESWVATQGASWLSDGMFAGVSIRVRRS